jgi:hypothetical protein
MIVHLTTNRSFRACQCTVIHPRGEVQTHLLHVSDCVSTVLDLSHARPHFYAGARVQANYFSSPGKEECLLTPATHVTKR